MSLEHWPLHSSGGESYNPAHNTCLRSTLVATRLESDDSIPSLTDLLVREVSLVLGCHLGSQGGPGVLGVVLGGPTCNQSHPSPPPHCFRTQSTCFSQMIIGQFLYNFVDYFVCVKTIHSYSSMVLNENWTSQRQNWTIGGNNSTIPREKMQSDTWGMFLASNKSGVWKTSSSGTPYFLAAVRKDWTFSISRKAGPFSLNFLTLSGLILFIRRQRTTPFWRTSAKSPSGSFSSRTASIHWEWFCYLSNISCIKSNTIPWGFLSPAQGSWEPCLGLEMIKLQDWYESSYTTVTAVCLTVCVCGSDEIICTACRLYIVVSTLTTSTPAALEGSCRDVM